jgi:hypothetical protein
MILAPAALFVKARKEDTSNDNDVEE